MCSASAQEVLFALPVLVTSVLIAGLTLQEATSLKNQRLTGSGKHRALLLGRRPQMRKGALFSTTT